MLLGDREIICLVVWQDTPWAPELRVSGFPSATVGVSEGKQLWPSPVDAILLDIMSGGNLEIARETHNQLLIPIDAKKSDRQMRNDGNSFIMSNTESNSVHNGDEVRDSIYSDTRSKGGSSSDMEYTSDQPSEQPPSKPLLRLSQKRWGLPIYLHGEAGNITVMTCPDSGSDENVIGLELAQSLGLPISLENEDQKDFFLANGKVVRSVGKMKSSCNFASGTTAVSPLEIFFYVFHTLATPIIMGMAFLEATQTFSLHRDRLVELDIPQTLSLRVNSIGIPRRYLLCRLNDDLAFANADSGSDLDFISLKYAENQGFQVHPNKESIMFADGSIDITSGVARLRFSIENLESDEASRNMKYSKSLSIEFHVFDKLMHDILIGRDTIEAFQIFTCYSSSLLPGLGLMELSSLNIIRHLKRLKLPGVSRVKGAFKRYLSKDKSAGSNSPGWIEDGNCHYRYT